MILVLPVLELNVSCQSLTSLRVCARTRPCACGVFDFTDFSAFTHSIADFRKKNHTPFLHCLQFVQNFFWESY